MRDLVYTGAGQIDDPGDIKFIDGKLTEQGAAALSSFVRQVVQKINVGMSFGDGTPSSHAGNLDGQVFPHAFKTANEEYEIPHGLKRRPIGYVVLQQDAPGSVYSSNVGGWGERNFYLKASAPMTVLLLVV